MPTLSPAKIIKIRQKLEPLAEKKGKMVADLLGDFVLIYEQTRGLVDEATIMQAIEAKLEEEGKEKEEIKIFPDIQEVKAEKKQLDLTGKLAKKSDEKMKDTFWENIDLSTGEFPPYLVVQTGLTMTLKLEDPNQEPRKNISKTYKRLQYIWNVILLGLDKKEAFKDKDEEGHEIYIKEKTYSLSMGKRFMQRFKDFYLENSDDGTSLEKTFSIKRTGSGFQTDYIIQVVE